LTDENLCSEKLLQPPCSMTSLVTSVQLRRAVCFFCAKFLTEFYKPKFFSLTYTAIEVNSVIGQ